MEAQLNISKYLNAYAEREYNVAREKLLAKKLWLVGFHGPIIWAHQNEFGTIFKIGGKKPNENYVFVSLDNLTLEPGTLVQFNAIYDEDSEQQFLTKRAPNETIYTIHKSSDNVDCVIA